MNITHVPANPVITTTQRVDTYFDRGPMLKRHQKYSGDALEVSLSRVVTTYTQTKIAEYTSEWEAVQRVYARSVLKGGELSSVELSVKPHELTEEATALLEQIRDANMPCGTAPAGADA